jgi:predicted RNase H-like nuclease (RuvC/YqgF family)
MPLFRQELHPARRKTNPKQKGHSMEVQDYCKAMKAEVEAWKEKLEAMKKTSDGFGSEQKEKILPLIGQLEQEVTTAQMRVEQLENECPSDWSPIKNELDELFGTVGSKINHQFQEMSSREALW